MLNLKLFGEVKVAVNGTFLTTQLPKKGIGLLIYMAAQPDKIFYREHLADLLWHNYTKKSALNNLRFTLWQTRKIIGEWMLEEELFINEGKHAIKINQDLPHLNYSW